MTQIDFYLLGSAGQNAQLNYACRLAEKAYRKGRQIYILTDSEQATRLLDDQLWTFKDDNFVPHEPYNDKGENMAPIVIGHNSEPKTPSDVLINLTSEVPLCFSSFERVAELVDAEESKRHNARERYRFYRERGYELKTHKL